MEALATQQDALRSFVPVRKALQRKPLVPCARGISMATPATSVLKSTFHSPTPEACFSSIGSCSRPSSAQTRALVRPEDLVRSVEEAPVRRRSSQDGGLWDAPSGLALGTELSAFDISRPRLNPKSAVALVLSELRGDVISSGGLKGIMKIAKDYIVKRGLDDTFYVVDLGNVLRMYQAWTAAMPRVVPHYAIKCNPEPGVLNLLNHLGAGYDCASKAELQQVLALGVHPSRIIFANPCKHPRDILYAREQGVLHTTFDTASELAKLAQLHPAAKCVLRIRADDPDARVPLGLKYGCDEVEVPALLAEAQRLGLDVVGVSFHVGSACKNATVFANAIQLARAIFDKAKAIGYNMRLLDIGGGFSGRFDPHGKVVLGSFVSAINAALATYFPQDEGVHVIAEPGRYFAESAATLLTPVFGSRERTMPDGSLRKDYWLTDGLYGSFNCMLYDSQDPEYEVLRSPTLPSLPSDIAAPLFKSTLWGPTCDSADCVYKDVMLPQLRYGDWLLFKRAGAYTLAGACDFNGISHTRPHTIYVYSENCADVVEGEQS